MAPSPTLRRATAWWRRSATAASAGFTSPIGGRPDRTCGFSRSTTTSPISTSPSTRSGLRSISSACARAAGWRCLCGAFSAQGGGSCSAARRSTSRPEQSQLSQMTAATFRSAAFEEFVGCRAAACRAARPPDLGHGAHRARTRGASCRCRRTIISAQLRDLQVRFEDWYDLTLDLPGTYYLQVVSWLFKQNRLAAGNFVALGRRIDLSSLATRSSCSAPATTKSSLRSSCLRPQSVSARRESASRRRPSHADISACSSARGRSGTPGRGSRGGLPSRRSIRKADRRSLDG